MRNPSNQATERLTNGGPDYVSSAIFPDVNHCWRDAEFVPPGKRGWWNRITGEFVFLRSTHPDIDDLCNQCGLAADYEFQDEEEAREFANRHKNFLPIEVSPQQAAAHLSTAVDRYEWDGDRKVFVRRQVWGPWRVDGLAKQAAKNAENAGQLSVEFVE